MAASGSALDYETAPQVTLSVVVADDGTPSQSASASMVVQILDANDNPVLNNASPTAKIALNSPVGSNVGAAWTASDQDSGHGESLVFHQSATLNDWAPFALDSTSGQVTVADNTALNTNSTRRQNHLFS